LQPGSFSEQTAAESASNHLNMWGKYNRRGISANIQLGKKAPKIKTAAS